MSLDAVSAKGPAGSPEHRKELLGRLGVRADASDQDIEAAHNALVEFLELAPPEAKSWAATRTAEVDEAFALLSGPNRAETAPAGAAMIQDKPDRTLRTSVPAAAAVNPRRLQLVWAIVPLLVVAVVVGVYFMGKGSDVPGVTGTPTGTATTAAASGPAVVPVDKAKVAALMTKITANPKDTVSLLAMGDIYFGAADYKNAAAWEQKVVDADPKNEKGLLALGAAQFNLGNTAVAKKHWLVAAKLYPNSAEVHYDLGFLYMSQTPPDTAKMRAEWKKVVDIDPTSDLAKTVATHINAPTATPSAK